ncbi:uncharacterized protein LOC110741372 isoform X2 [Papio anubis]|uniref:uncharacterized protein LOC110741372 isoform X2 n=1 Tax=Papio anubis TaxID=9555 RepID=UPI0012AD9133|nr:uncharacterized protein LOC110741372 isoform X2 [Papio anubis]
MTPIPPSSLPPLDLLRVFLFVFNASLLVREKQRIPQNSFLYPLSRKMGQFTAAIVGRISCLGVWKLPRVESCSQPARPLLSLAQTTTKTTATTTTTTKHATCAPAYTNTPTEPNQADKASRRASGRLIPVEKEMTVDYWSKILSSIQQGQEMQRINHEPSCPEEEKKKSVVDGRSKKLYEHQEAGNMSVA